MARNAVELLRCWKGRTEERALVLAIGGFLVASVVGTAVLVQEYSHPTLLAALARPPATAR